MLALSAAVECAQHFASSIAAPPAISIVTSIANSDNLFNITLGLGIPCVCEEPICSGTQLKSGGQLTYRGADRCNYFSVGGQIASAADGTVCYTFQTDYKKCTVFPGDAFTTSFTTEGSATCARLIGASCSMRASFDGAGLWKEYPTVITLTGAVDTTCNALPWESCTEASSCCGGDAGFACRHTQPDAYGTDDDVMERMCQPPHGPGWTSDPRVFRAWEAKGVNFNGN